MSYSNALHSHKAQLLATAAAASLATAGLISAYNTFSRRKRRSKLDEDVLRSLKAHDARELRLPPELSSAEPSAFQASSSVSPPAYGYDEALIREQLARNYVFFGEEAMEKIRDSSVAIIGCGGVGSAVAVMCARRYVLCFPSAVSTVEELAC
jgi:tRNA threonylcarbamoyladenosine dehydratase